MHLEPVPPEQNVFTGLAAFTTKKDLDFAKTVRHSTLYRSYLIEELVFILLK